MDFFDGLFKDHFSLINHLEEKAKKYPLITKIYIPIIKGYSEKKPNFSDFDDWLQIPYFQYLWDLGDNKFDESAKVRLYEIEKNLVLINNVLGSEEFEKLCEEILRKCSSLPTINDIYDKLLDFSAEFRGILYFADRGYKIERIPEINKKTPDFQAIKDNEIINVECKFIHASNPVRTYINRYINFISKFHPFFGIKNLHKFSYNPRPQALDAMSIREIKKFIQEIIRGELISYTVEITQKYKVNIDYKRKEELGLALITIENQVSYFNAQLQEFYDNYVLRRATQAIAQLNEYSAETHKQCVYIFIELDEEYHMPWDEIQESLKLIQKKFLENHKLDVEIISDYFPKRNQ